MVNSDIGEERLELFDSLDLDRKEERRVQVLALLDFYSEVIVEIGTDYLGLKKDMKQGNLNEKWKRVRHRLVQVPSISSEGEYETAIGDLKDMRDTTFHEYDYWPNKEELEKIRESAEEFRDWLIDQSKIYSEQIDELDTKETMVRMAESNIEHVLRTDPTHEPFKSDMEQKIESAKALRDDLDSQSDEEEISMKLVNILLESMELAEEASKLRSAEQVDYVLGEIAEPETHPDEFDL